MAIKFPDESSSDGDPVEDENELPPLAPDCTLTLTSSPAPTIPNPTTLNGDIPPSSCLHGLSRVDHPRLPTHRPGGQNLLQKMRNDKYAIHRRTNIHYPFRSAEELQLAQWLTYSSITQAQIDSFLKLIHTRQNPPSFTSSRDLQIRIENLPSVPSWQHRTIKIPGYETKEPMVLFWRDGLEVIKHIYSNPVFANCMDERPYRLTDPEQNDQRVYGDFMSADFAWDYYSALPEGHGMVGVIAASDKTPLTLGTGNKEMHPLLLSIANIHPAVRMKASSHSFVLAAYLPIPKFKGVTSTVHAALVAQVFHKSVSIVVENLRHADQLGAEMSDYNGEKRINHTPLVSYIADLPEMHTISCTTHNQSPLTLATLEDFGDDQSEKPHIPRDRHHTLNNILRARFDIDPGPINFPEFVKAAAKLGLLAVEEPFWAKWGMACPSLFLTPDALHAWHKFYFDHVVSWATNMVGGPELDRRLASLQPHVGVRHWPNGVSTLKQLTGREHRDLEKILVPCIAGAVTSHVLRASRAMTEFIIQAQGVLIYEEQNKSIDIALHEFHYFKNSIIKQGGRKGANGPIPHFNIPKLEGMGMVTRSVRYMGAPYQYTSDITERCHSTHVKMPYRKSNKRNHHEQMARWMDRREKLRTFGLYTALESNNLSLVNALVQEASEATDPYPEDTWLSQVLPAEELTMLVGSSHSRPSSLFAKSQRYQSNDRSIAFTVAKKPHQIISVDEVHASHVIKLGDFRAAIGDFLLDRAGTDRHNRRRSPPNCVVGFARVKIWHSFRMQQHSAQDPRITLPPRTIQALPVSDTMPYGRGNVVLINHPTGSLLSSESEHSSTGQRPLILFYGHCYKFSAQHRELLPDGRTRYRPEPGIDMFVVEHHVRANGDRMGDVFVLTDIREILELVPRFGEAIPDNIDCNNSLEKIDSFYINNFSDKETFHSILSYQ
ncbi:hypothetical protein HWV62_10006 [Athelia sp. TMB]|nr:hypothetical protein HWV62_10006 [Athelia sp. TMB]